MENKKGLIIIWNKWYFIIIGLIFLLLLGQDIWNSYNVNLDSEALKNKFSFRHKQVEKNHTQIYLTQIKDNLLTLNLEYQKLNCSGIVSKDIYNDCNNLYFQISNLTDIHNLILNGSFIPDELIVKNIVDDESKNDEGEIQHNYNSYSEEGDTTLFIKSFQYTYEDEIYNLELELSNNKYNSYLNYEREYSYYGSLPLDWEHDYYKMFVNEGNDDELIKEVIKEIRNNPKIRNNGDELKAVINFVQNIPYDYDSYNNPDDVINYPYETIFENKGVCSDVSILLIKLLLELDYETVGFIFENANHMAVGIKCPENQSNFNTNYCFIEATGVTEIGIVPENYGIYGNISLDKNPKIINFGGSKVYNEIIEDKEKQTKLIETYGTDYLLMNSEQKKLTEKMTLLELKIEDLEKEYKDEDCEGTIYIDTPKEKICDSIYSNINRYINNYNDFVKDFNSLD